MALTLRTDSALEAALEALVAAEGLSRQELIRRAVMERYARTIHRDLVHGSADRLVVEWADVLDRLGTV